MDNIWRITKKIRIYIILKNHENKIKRGDFIHISLICILFLVCFVGFSRAEKKYRGTSKIEGLGVPARTLLLICHNALVPLELSLSFSWFIQNLENVLIHFTSVAFSELRKTSESYQNSILRRSLLSRQLLCHWVAHRFVL